jgi:hypothetical protein
LRVLLRSPAALATIAVKAALVGLLLFAVARPDLPRFAGKAMTGRAIAYPLVALVVPAVWWFLRRRRSRRVEYPYALDILVVLPFLIDTAGNAANLYDTVGWWDDANHFVNWALLVAGFGRLLVRLPYGRLVSAALAVGFGAVTAILWEFLEYYTFIRHSKELRTAYTDTLGDLALGLAGSARRRSDGDAALAPAGHTGNPVVPIGNASDMALEAVSRAWPRTWPKRTERLLLWTCPGPGPGRVSKGRGGDVSHEDGERGEFGAIEVQPFAASHSRSSCGVRRRVPRSANAGTASRATRATTSSLSENGLTILLPLSRARPGSGAANTASWASE